MRCQRFSRCHIYVSWFLNRTWEALVKASKVTSGYRGFKTSSPMPNSRLDDARSDSWNVASKPSFRHKIAGVVRLVIPTTYCVADHAFLKTTNGSTFVLIVVRRKGMRLRFNVGVSVRLLMKQAPLARQFANAYFATILRMVVQT